MTRVRSSPQPGRTGPVGHTHGSYGQSDADPALTSRGRPTSESYREERTNVRAADARGDRTITSVLETAGMYFVLNKDKFADLW